MDWTALPPLTALRAFAALAETGGYTQAARALNVSHAAVIQQVRALETRLGLPLARRAGRGVELTEEGAALARELEAGFAAIARGVEALTGAGAQRPVQVTMSPAFAVKWLMPRMADFQQKQPETTLLLDPTGRNRDLRPGGVDLAIRYFGPGRAPEGADRLIEVNLLVAGTPGLLAGKDVSTPAALAALPWLQELGTNEVGNWFAARGVAPEGPVSISHMPGNLIMEAVLRGDGLTYTAREWIAPELAEGRLVGLFPDETPGGFHVMTQPGAQRPPVRAFLRWLKEQAGAATPMRLPRRPAMSRA